MSKQIATLSSPPAAALALEGGDTTLSGSGVVALEAPPAGDDDGADGRGGGGGGKQGASPVGGLLMTGARGRVRVSGNYTEAAVAAVAAATAAAVPSSSSSMSSPPPPPPPSEGVNPVYGTPPQVSSRCPGREKASRLPQEVLAELSCWVLGDGNSSSRRSTRAGGTEGPRGLETGNGELTFTRERPAGSFFS